MQSVRCQCGTLSTFLPCEDCQAKAWAKEQGFTVARRGACIGQLIRRHICRAGGSCPVAPAMDHIWMFREEGRPVAFVTEPYPSREVGELVAWCEERGLKAVVSDKSWHGFGTKHIEITKGAK